MFTFFSEKIIATTTHTLTRMLDLRLPQILATLLIPGANSPTAPAADCTQGSVGNLLAVGISHIVQIGMGVGISLAVLGIIAGGLMRATSFGNERRIAMSNTAITCAVVGLVIVLIGYSLGNALPTWFGVSGDTTGCQIQKQ